MPRRPSVSVENNFTGGLKTEYTGLNFPENSCTDTDNCVFTKIGTVYRRLGLDYEENYLFSNIFREGRAINSFVWYNADGAGEVNFLVEQVGETLYFSKISSAITEIPISRWIIGSIVNLSPFVTGGGELNSIECQFAAGNGYLFVFHPDLDPIYCSYAPSPDTIHPTRIDVKIRDLTGLVEDGVADNYRPPNLSAEHQYNLGNQGWGRTFEGTSLTTITIGLGDQTITTIESGLPIFPGDRIRIYETSNATAFMSGVVVSYDGATLITNITLVGSSGSSISDWTIVSEPNLFPQWKTTIGNYPSNADVWWYFKNSSDVFDPATTIDQVSYNSGPSPKGAYILDAWEQSRSVISGLSVATTSTGGIRPTSGTWFQGRVWYTGVNFTGFNESVYFSQIVENPSQFGYCYQVNDPTSQERFDILPSDGGIVKIQGAGNIFNLFPVQNGLLVFAHNGIWFITGNTGIGFTATDYTVTKISAVRTISATSFVNVQGYPMWWNAEGIYTVTPSQQGSLEVNLITVATISTFYEEIPLQSKRYARGDYNPLTYTVQWVFKDTNELGITDRYSYNRVLNLNMVTNAFFPWTVDNTFNSLHDVKYIVADGGTDIPDPMFKYFCSHERDGAYLFTYAEERSDTYTDWSSSISGPQNYKSTFTTGYKLHGDAQRKFQPMYIYMYSDNPVDTAYFIQAVWDYALTGNSGRISTPQFIDQSNNGLNNFGKIFNRHKIRGSGHVLQFKVTSSDGKPFYIIGWSVFETSAGSI